MQRFGKEAVWLRRYAFLVLILALSVSGCLSRNPGPVVESQHGLITVSLADSDPIPWSPYNPPILTATVRPSPLLEGGYDECQARLDDPDDFLERICAAAWNRTVVTPGELEKISVVLMTDSQATRFRIIFAGHRPGEVAEGLAVSREFVAPPYWSGELEFDVPIYPPFTRVFFLQVEWRGDDDWYSTSQEIVFAPCPSDLPWPDGGKEWCDSVAR